MPGAVHQGLQTAKSCHKVQVLGEGEEGLWREGGGVKQRVGKHQTEERKHRKEGKVEEKEPQTCSKEPGAEEQAFRNVQNRQIYRDRKVAG